MAVCCIHWLVVHQAAQLVADVEVSPGAMAVQVDVDQARCRVGRQLEEVGLALLGLYDGAMAGGVSLLLPLGGPTAVLAAHDHP